MDVVNHHPILDAEAVQRLGSILYDKNDLYLIEKYGVAYSDTWLYIYQNYWSLTIYLSILYVISIQIGQRLMALRQPFQLRNIMLVWNITIASISTFGSVRTATGIYQTWRDYGLHYAVCHPHYYYNITSLWGIIFILTKPVELFDTAFIILRKHNLIFLHWYHHVTVLVYVVLSVASHSVPAIWFCCLNFSIHSLMYSYYALKSLKLSLPRYLPVMITTGQIFQMMCGLTVLFYVMYLRLAGTFCQISNLLLVLGIFMYLSYFVLFVKFFYKSYYLGRFWKKDSFIKKTE